jgi:hypothetical protein
MLLLEQYVNECEPSCRVHSNLLADADFLRLNAAVFKVATLDRYLAEDLLERYAIFDFGSSNARYQWPR